MGEPDQNLMDACMCCFAHACKQLQVSASADGYIARYNGIWQIINLSQRLSLGRGGGMQTA